ncbi:luciferase-like monooxygenase [Renibacterium salmoninarum ATCC 33209]|uniref:Luciferase-like monooxygenase n=1 Tax=Renibacterium salmoninarum (strain ATCC 33209 / DSM 20767 / JCM 11484 / NBRC 15589 / NCIMB 2235) TaxID=288705 RepID=A9WNW8_RENSM|nr:luciferase-like monooxygenase [Renibacterium salmoninarum ATCC 33209]
MNRILPACEIASGGVQESAEWVGKMGVNLMSSTLLTEDGGMAFHELQADQIRRYRASWAEAGHQGTPRVSVSRSVFPIMNDLDRMYFGSSDVDQVGVIDGFRSTFGKSYAGEPDQLIEELLQDSAVQEADTLMLTIPTQLGVEYNMHVLESFAQHMAPELGCAAKHGNQLTATRYWGRNVGLTSVGSTFPRFMSQLWGLLGDISLQGRSNLIPCLITLRKQFSSSSTPGTPPVGWPTPPSRSSSPPTSAQLAATAYSSRCWR